MFIIESQTAKASIVKQEEANVIVDAMGASDQEGIMRSMIKAACRNASLDVGSLDHSSILVDRRSYLYDGREKPLIGDVFFYNDNLLILEPSKSKIQISEVRHCAASSVLRLL